MPYWHAFGPLPEKTAIIITGFFFQKASQPLQQVSLQITSNSKCNSAYDYPGGITDHMLCAGDPNVGKGACGVIGSL